MSKHKFGKGPCPGCKAAGRSTQVLFTENDQGTLAYRCDECFAGDYARTGTQKRDDWLKTIERIAPPAPEVKPKPDGDAKPPKKGFLDSVLP